MKNWEFNVNKPCFDSGSFKSYLVETYKGFDGTDGLFLRNIIDNIVWMRVPTRTQAETSSVASLLKC